MFFHFQHRKTFESFFWLWKTNPKWILSLKNQFDFFFFCIDFDNTKAKIQKIITEWFFFQWSIFHWSTIAKSHFEIFRISNTQLKVMLDSILNVCFALNYKLVNTYWIPAKSLSHLGTVEHGVLRILSSLHFPSYTEPCRMRKCMTHRGKNWNPFCVQIYQNLCRKFREKSEPANTNLWIHLIFWYLKCFNHGLKLTRLCSFMSSWMTTKSSLTNKATT